MGKFNFTLILLGLLSLLFESFSCYIVYKFKMTVMPKNISKIIDLMFYIPSAIKIIFIIVTSQSWFNCTESQRNEEIKKFIITIYKYLVIILPFLLLPIIFYLFNFHIDKRDDSWALWEFILFLIELFVFCAYAINFCYTTFLLKEIITQIYQKLFSVQVMQGNYYFYNNHFE